MVGVHSKNAELTTAHLRAVRCWVASLWLAAGQSEHPHSVGQNSI